MKRTASILVAAFLLLAVAGTQFVNLGRANPTKYYFYVKNLNVAPDRYTKPPTISLLSIENDTAYAIDTIALSLNVSIGDSSTATGCSLLRVYYTTDWQSNDTYVYYNTPPKTLFSKTINISGIPDGNHNLTVHAIETGRYELYDREVNVFRYERYYNEFSITGSSFVRFSVDTTTPKVSVLSPENLTYYSTKVPLNLTVSEKSSLMFYSLDGQENVSMAGNATLKNLSFGEHNVTVYATDMAGHTGAFETIYFKIEMPFPTTMVIAPIASVAFVGAGLLVYFKKRKKLSV